MQKFDITYVLIDMLEVICIYIIYIYINTIKYTNTRRHLNICTYSVTKCLCTVCARVCEPNSNHNNNTKQHENDGNKTK